MTDQQNAADQPDGYMIRHSRMTDTVHFGPFATWEEVDAFLVANPQVRGAVIPLYRTVDWSR